uniref:diphosphoinositol-polyphosphate diphosphatase n=1 Tax=Anopheles epiroticus TaxID=199890 RepID=A0A182PTD2_9DIPT
MVKEKPNSTRIYDKDGYRRRAACICVRSEAEAEVLLVTSSRRPELWIVPGGGVEPEEEASLTATREVLEEAGVMGQLGRCLGVFENSEHMHRTEVFVMVVTQELDEWEDSKTIGRKRQWFSIEEALSQLALHKPTQRHYLQQLRHSKHRTSSSTEPPPIISEHDNDDFTSEPEANNCSEDAADDKDTADVIIPTAHLLIEYFNPTVRGQGVAFKNLRCAMCRCDIPLTYLDHPQLVNGVEEIVRAATATVPDGNEYRWYYEGGHGWWQYDERTSQELEEAYLRGDKSCKILVAGFVYIVSFEHKCQIRQNDYSRIRRIKRDLVSIPKKGVAGLRLETGEPSTQPPTANDMNELSSAMGEMNLNEGASTSAATNVVVPGRSDDSEIPSQRQTDGESAQSTDSDTTSTAVDGDVPCISTTTSSAPQSSASSVAIAATRSMSELIDLHYQEYATTDSDDEESDADENLLVL